jgi:hypothetical protein
MTVTELRPLSLGELLDRTFSLYREHFWLFAGIMVLPQLVVLVVAVPLRVASRNQPNISTTTIPAHAASVIFLAFLFVAAYLAMHMTALAATVSAVSEVHLGRPTSVRLAYSFLRGKWWRVLWVAILNVLIVGLGFLLFFIPGVIVLVRTAVAIPAAVLENQSGWAAIKRADLLTERHRGHIFLVFVLFAILDWAATFIFALPFGMVGYLLHGPTPGWLSELGDLAGFLRHVLVGPLLTIALTLVYYDLRVRKEGFDLQLMVAALGDVGSAPPPPAPSSAA